LHSRPLQKRKWRLHHQRNIDEDYRQSQNYARLPIWEDEWEHPEAYSNPRLLHNIDGEGIRL
jgi:hypothetical protein